MTALAGGDLCETGTTVSIRFYPKIVEYHAEIFYILWRTCMSSHLIYTWNTILTGFWTLGAANAAPGKGLVGSLVAETRTLP